MTVFIKAVYIWTLHEKGSMVSNKFNSIMRAKLPSKLHAYNYAMNTTGEWLKTWLWLLARPIHTEISCDIHCQNTSVHTWHTLSEHFLFTQKYHVMYSLNTSCTHRNITWYTLSEHQYTEISHDLHSEHFLYFQKYHVIYTVRTLLVYTEISHDLHCLNTSVLPEIPCDIHCQNTSCIHRNITWSSLSEHFCTSRNTMWYTLSEHFL